MSGLCGVWRADGAPVAAAEVRAMSAALAHRGRDAAGHWVEGPVALAHRLLATTRASLGLAHPVADPTGALRLVWDGRLDNRAALGGRPDEADETLVLRAWERWGEALPERLLGDFALALWDGRRRRLFCARDRLGLKPFFYTWQAGVFRFASEPEPLLPSLPAREPDDEMLLALLLREFRPGDEARTLVRGVHRLPPGAALVVDAGGPRLRRYWALDPARLAPPGPEEDDVARFGALFREAVAARLRTDWPVGALLSGGLDSSAIVCTAERLYEERGEGSPPLETFTLWADHPAGDERAPAAAVTAATGLKAHAVRRVPADPLAGLDGALDAAGSPIVDPSHRTMAACLAAVRDAGCRVLLSGEGGDQLLDEHGYLADLLRTLRLRAFLVEARAFARWYGAPAREVALLAAAAAAPAPVKYWGKRWLRGVPPRWIAAGTARRCGLRARVRRPRDASAWPSCAQADTALSLTSPYYGLKLEVEERLAARAGLEMRYPLLDSRLVEFVLGLPWPRRRSAGERKRLLRAAARDVLPPATLARRGKGDWTEPMDRALAAACAARPPAPLANRSGVLDRYVDLAGAGRLVRRYLAGAGDLRWEVWFLVTVDRWLDRVVNGKGGSR